MNFLKEVALPLFLIFAATLLAVKYVDAKDIYKGEIIRVIDGDTVEAVFDLGMGVYFRDKVRLKGINAPETRGDERPRGLAAKDYLIELIQHNNNVTILVDKKGKYGRWIGTIYHEDYLEPLNEIMIKSGNAIRVNY